MVTIKRTVGDLFNADAEVYVLPVTGGGEVLQDIAVPAEFKGGWVKFQDLTNDATFLPGMVGYSRETNGRWVVYMCLKDWADSVDDPRALTACLENLVILINRHAFDTVAMSLMSPEADLEPRLRALHSSVTIEVVENPGAV